MKEILQEANDQFYNGHSTINQLIMVEFKQEKYDDFLGASYWVYNNKTMAYHETLPNHLNYDEIEYLDQSVQTTIRDQNFF